MALLSTVLFIRGGYMLSQAGQSEKIAKPFRAGHQPMYIYEPERSIMTMEKASGSD